MGTYSAAILADSPDVYYRMAETGSGPFVDVVAAHNATPNGTINSDTSLIPGDPGNAAARFDYTTACENADSAYSVVQYPITIECWIKPQSLNADSGGLISVVSGGSSTGWWIGYDTSGFLTFILHGVGVYTSGVSVAAGVASHIAFVATNAPLVHVYKDGAFAQTIFTATMFLGSEFLSIGGIIGNSTQYHGQVTIDEVAVYKAQLSTPQIAAHYAAAFVNDGVPRQVAGWITRSGGN